MQKLLSMTYMLRVTSIIRLFILTLGFVMSFSNIAQSNESTPFVDTNWLLSNIDNDDVSLLQFHKDKYSPHLVVHNAVIADYAKWRAVGEGRVPSMILPEAKLEAIIQNHGVKNSDHVVIITGGANSNDLATATRIYWTFKVAGHEKVSILLEGLRGYYIHERTRQTNIPKKPQKSDYKVNWQSQYIADKKDVENAINNQTISLIDTRSEAEFHGIWHSEKNREGHIPSALNFPYNWLTWGGSAFLQEMPRIGQLLKIYNLDKDKSAIFYCQSAHRASLSWFVASELFGFKDAKLYDGSMAEWAKLRNLPMNNIYE